MNRDSRVKLIQQREGYNATRVIYPNLNWHTAYMLARMGTGYFARRVGIVDDPLHKYEFPHWQIIDDKTGIVMSETRRDEPGTMARLHAEQKAGAQ